MDVTRERITRIFIILGTERNVLVKAAVVCALLESISGWEPSSDTTEPSYLKLGQKLETVTITNVYVANSLSWSITLFSRSPSFDWQP